jgi:hypothetical protein
MEASSGSFSRDREPFLDDLELPLPCAFCFARGSSNALFLVGVRRQHQGAGPLDTGQRQGLASLPPEEVGGLVEGVFGECLELPPLEIQGDTPGGDGAQERLEESFTVLPVARLFGQVTDVARPFANEVHEAGGHQVPLSSRSSPTL